MTWADEPLGACQAIISITCAASCTARPITARMASRWRRDGRGRHGNWQQTVSKVAADPILAVEHLTLALPAGADRPFAAEDVSLELYPGQILCVVGESGSGKSMCAFALLGLLPKAVRPAGGRIMFEGRDLLTLPVGAWREIRGQTHRHDLPGADDRAQSGDPDRRSDLETFEAHGRLTVAERRATDDCPRRGGGSARS